MSTVNIDFAYFLTVFLKRIFLFTSLIFVLVLTAPTLVTFEEINITSATPTPAPSVFVIVELTGYVPVLLPVLVNVALPLYPLVAWSLNTTVLLPEPLNIEPVVAVNAPVAVNSAVPVLSVVAEVVTTAPP